MLDIKEKKRKEKKRKGLFYLIITISIIAAIVISCSDKPTASNDFAGFDDSVSVGTNQITTENFKNFLGKSIRSRKSLDVGGIGYFWADFDNSGIKYGQGDELNKGSLPYSASLATDAFTNNRAHFTDNNGTIEFQLGGNIITNIKITLSNNNFGNYGTFDAQFVQ